MFNKSFKAAKCKTSLKLACSRIKLLKNKKEVQVKQMKRDLAKLLESGQDRTAMIKVEHVVAEEKKLSACDLIEIYCELIVARLQIIESQKNCPIELKEAITSVIFASPLCVDVPELMDARKHFTSKYGKEFVSAAVELRPNCGVARMMIEKLSVKAPDGQTKIQILKSIAKEQNIKWDPSGDNDPTPPEDLLNGPSTFGKASQMYADHPNVQVQPNYDDKRQSAFQTPFSHDENRRSGHYYQNSAPTEIGDIREPNSGSSRSGSENGVREFRHSYSGAQKWNMEFKDAAEAAQAAAEAADQASMAARAAAQLSSRENVTRQYSSGSSYDMYSGSRFEGSRSSSLNSHSSSFEGNSTKSESVDRMSFNRQFSKSGFKSSSGEQVDDTRENIGYYAEVRIRKQLSNTSSHSHSRDCSKDGEVLPNKTSSHDKASLVFDESGSDYDDEDVTHKYKEHESVLFFSSPRQNVSHSLFTASSAADSRSDYVFPVTFDDSDGPSSESEDDMNISKPAGSTKFDEKFGFSDFASKLDKSHEVSDNDNSHLYNEQLSRPWLLHEQVKDKFGASELPHTISESQLVKESTLPELNLGTLTGGLRNKGCTYRSPSENAFLSKRAVEDTYKTERSSSPPRVQTSHSFGVGGQQLYNQKAKTRVNRKSKSMSSNARLDRDSDEEIPRGLGRRNHNMTIHVKNKSTSYFDSDNSDSEHLPEHTPTSKACSGIGFSRRTKASPHCFNDTVSTERQVSPGHNAERTRTRPFTESHADSESSYHAGDVEWARKPVYKPVSHSARPLREQILKSAARELSPDPRQRVVLPSTIKSPMTLSLNVTESKAKQLLSDSRPKTLSLSSAGSPSKEKPSHVHPKLPDIDSFTAHFLSLRSNRG